MKKRLNFRGFTIVELMIATVVFSVILLLLTAGIISVGNIYYRGITSSRTQAATRAISDNVVQAIQYSADSIILTAGTPGTPGAPGAVCAGGKKYSYKLNTKKDDTNSVLLIEDYTSVAGCTPNMTPGPNTIEQIGKNMTLTRFDITENTVTGNFNVRVRVVSGDNDLFEGDSTDNNCKGGAGSQFCAVSSLDTEVRKVLQ